MKSLHAALLAVACAVATAAPTSADEARFPLTVSYDLLRTALRTHLKATGGAGLELWRSADGCGAFVIKDPTLTAADGRVKIRGPASGEAGLRFFGLCWANVSWHGDAEISARPEIGGDWQLRLRDIDVQLYDAKRIPSVIAPRLSTVVKQWSEAELARFTFDLGPPVREVSTLLGAFGGSDVTTPLAAALRTLRPVGLAVAPEAVRVFVALDVPAAAAPRPSEPALTPVELTRFEARLDEWDGFLAFVVGELGGEPIDAAVRDELLALLLDTRREVVDILARGPQPGTDAVRRIFLGKWDRLRTLVPQTRGQAGDDLTKAFRYVVFLAAGDALAAIDAVAPAAGLDFSADGLRRLARTLDPGFSGDPLEQTDEPDPRLQERFRIRDPDAPPRLPRARPPGTWHWFAPRPAHADAGDEWRALGARLDRWVPSPAERGVYRAKMDRLLTLAAQRSLDPDRLDERFHRLFHHVVKATAWQESCWRQFIRRGEEITYIASDTGDVGLMQVNVRVWRGFFSVTKLRWNAAYNAGAGAEILQQLLSRYGVREAGSAIENAARASYSAYQAGPSRYRRYRTAAATAPGAAIDRAFWTKFQAVAAGTADDVLCLRP